MPLRLSNVLKQPDFRSNFCGGYINDFRRTFLRCHDGRDIGEITFGRATSPDEPSLPLGSTGKSRSTPMSTKYQSSTDSCLHVPRPVQLSSRLIDGIGGISGYARAYRPMALCPRWSERPHRRPAA